MIEFIKDLITIGGGIGAIIAIWKAVTALVHFRDDIEDIKKHNYENWVSLQRITIMSEDMPLGERIIAGQKYIAAGENGEVKQFCKTHLHIDDTLKDFEENEDKFN